MQFSSNGKATLRKLEKCVLTSYWDAIGCVWTIGDGITGPDIVEGMTITQEEADRMLDERLRPYVKAVNDNLSIVTPTQNQFDACVIFCWNVGIAGFAGSTVVKRHNEGNFAAAANAFSMWVKAKGKVIPGLVNRRAAEARLYLKDLDIPDSQTVDAPKPLLKSNINIASATGGTVATLGAVHETLDAVKQFQDDVASIKTYLMPLAFVAIVVLCGVVIWQRVGLRKDGVV